jgi:NAD(P)-dependent dehydrogenase (short-subunit alcohol dehydrogenase family)
MPDTEARLNERPGQPLAVVIGAGGMAMAIARRLGASYRLLVADLDGAHLDRQVSALGREGHDVTGLVCDVTDPGAVHAVAEAANKAGPVRALAHVVGLSPSMADALSILRVNLVGPTLIARAFFELAQPGTAAVFIASLAAHLGPLPGAAADAADEALAPDLLERVSAAAERPITSGEAYQISKFALIRMCERQAQKWGERGARIMSLSPGLIATPMGAREFEAQPSKHRLLELIPLRRQGTMVEIADAVEFLLSDRASFISGVDLLIDGGLAAAIRHSSPSQHD